MSPILPDQQPVEIVRVPFHGTYLHTILADGEPHVVLKPTVEGMGLDWEPQRKKLARRSWGITSQREAVAEDGKVREMVACGLETWSMLLANIDENRVNEAARPVLIAYQMESAQALRDYWTQGGAINPRATEEQLDSLISRAKQQAEVLSILSGIVDSSWLETKARLVAARALGEEPDVDPLDVPLYVPDFLKSLGLKRKDIESAQSWFGRYASAICTELRIELPQERQSELPNGQVRSTKAWTERHRPVFELTWARHYAHKFPGLFDLGGAA